MSNSAFTPTTTQVTTEVPVNVPVVTAWQSYTPTFEGFGTPTAVSALWRRIGDSIEVRGQFTSGSASAALATISLPSGFNLDSTKLNGAQTNVLGSMFRSNSIVTGIPSGTRGPWTITESKSINTSKVYVSTFTDLATAGVFQVQAGNALTASGEILTFEFRAPISQWSSGTTTLADRAVEEFFSHNGTAQVNGPDGATMLTTTPAGASESFTITSASSVLSTDSFSIEFQRGGVGGWFRSTDRVDPLRFDGTNFIGAGVYFDGTNIVLIRGKYARGVTSPWSGLSGDKWRVRKVQSGAAVGYPVSARNIIGDTSGSVVPTGMLGQIVQETTSANGGTNTVANVTNTNVRVLSLPAGTWDVVGYASINNLPTTPVRQILTLTTSSATNGTQTIDRFDYMYPASLTGSFGTSTPQVRLNLATTTTIYLVMYSQGASGSVTVDGAQIRAIRIA